MAKEVEKKEIVAPESSALSLSAEFQQEQNTGFEETNSRDYAIPILSLLQKNSPQCDPDSGKYIPEAKPGMFYDAGTEELMESVKVIPCHYKNSMVEWRPRESGGGFIAAHNPEAEFIQKLPRNEKGFPVCENGNIIIDTRYFFCARINKDGDVMPIILSLSSTQTKKARSWLTKMRAMKVTGKDGKRFTPPMYSHIYRLTSVPEQNDKGTWRGYKIEMESPIEDANLFKAAKEFREMFITAAVNIKPQEEHTADPVESGEEKSM